MGGRIFYHKPELDIRQGKRLMRALDPWLDSHKHLELFPTPTWRPLKVDHMRHLMRDAIRAAALPDECTLHGFRYTFATRAIEFGLDWQTIESIVGHRTAEMACKYTAKRRSARLAITTLGHPTDDGEITNEGTRQWITLISHRHLPDKQNLPRALVRYGPANEP